MSPSTKSKWSAALAVIVSGAGLLGLAAGIRYIMSTDALAQYRTKGEELMRDGVTVKGFQLRNYSENRLVASADVDEAVIMDDWSLVNLKGVKNGTFLTPEGKKYFFETDTATYGTYTKAVIVDHPVRVWGDKVDIKSDGLTYDDGQKLVTVKGNVTGKLGGGDLIAKSVLIKTDVNKITGSSATWAGPIELQEAKKRSKWNIQTDNFELDGDIFVAYQARGNDDDMVVKSDKMTHDRKNDIITGEGNVRYWGKEANLTCDKIVIYRKEGRAVLSGSKPVGMLLKPETETTVKEDPIPPLTPLVPDEIRKTRPAAPGEEKQTPEERKTDNLRKYPTVIEAKQIEYWYKEGERRAIATGNPWARQQLGPDAWRTLTAFKALYDGEKELLDLLSKGSDKKDVHMKNSLGDDFLADTIQVSTKEGVDKMSGKGLQGVYVPQEDEDLPKTGGSGGGSGSTGGGLSGPIGR